MSQRRLRDTDEPADVEYRRQIAFVVGRAEDMLRLLPDDEARAVAISLLCSRWDDGGRKL